VTSKLSLSGVMWCLVVISDHCRGFMGCAAPIFMVKVFYNSYSLKLEAACSCK
jgi:hypothetical protein